MKMPVSAGTVLLLCLISAAPAIGDTTATPCAPDDFGLGAQVVITKSGSKARALPDTICVPPIEGVVFDVQNGKDFKADFNGTSPFPRTKIFNKQHPSDFVAVVCNDGSLGAPPSPNYDSRLGGCVFHFKISHFDNEGHESVGDPHVIVQAGGGGSKEQRIRTNRVIQELLDQMQTH
jgi:hypothetical protein